MGFRWIIVAAIITINISNVYSADQNYSVMINAGDYKNALVIINKQIDEIYSKRVENKRVPTDFIKLGSDREAININRLFRERKAESFLIEDNPIIYQLHKDAGKCLYETRVYDEALNHYYQGLRFRKIRYDGEDQVFYNIAQIYKKQGREKGYLDALETAYSVNQRYFAYSLELGKALYRTKEKKKAIYHLERYVQVKGDEIGDLSILIMLAGLNEDIGRYIETEKYYGLYLSKKPGDGYIQFALGFISFNNTGNYIIAENAFRKALELLPEKEIYRRSKAHEYLGDMKFNTLKWDEAITDYKKTMKYQDLVIQEISKSEEEIIKINKEIQSLKSDLLKEKNLVKYNEYQFQLQEKERILSEKREKKYEYDRLNPGKPRWNLAVCFEKIEKLDDAIVFFRQTISFNYRPNDAREKILKLQLKIKRGY
jgi:tetratricopeptide (TPR) repeat protein